LIHDFLHLIYNYLVLRSVIDTYISLREAVSKLSKCGIQGNAFCKKNFSNTVWNKKIDMRVRNQDDCVTPNAIQVLHV